MNGEQWNYCKATFFFGLICLACVATYACLFFKEENLWLFKEGGSLRGSTLHLNKECFLLGNN